MMTDNYKNKLLRKLQDYVLYITYSSGDYHFDKPYTLNEAIAGTSVSQNDNEDEVTVWSMIDEEVVDIQCSDILGFTMVGYVDDVEVYNKNSVDIVESDKLKIEELSSVITEEDISMLYFRDDVNRMELNLMARFGIPKLSNLRNNIKATLTKVKSQWKTALMERKAEVIQLLQTEKDKALASNDDAMAKDLSSIEKTLNDLDPVIDSDLKKIKTVEGILDYWPNLLLPPPREFISYKYVYTGKYSKP